MAERLVSIDDIVSKYAVVSNPVKSKIYVKNTRHFFVDDN